MLYLAAWYALSGVVFLLLGFETRGRSLEELDQAPDKPVEAQPVQVAARLNRGKKPPQACDGRLGSADNQACISSMLTPSGAAT